MASTLGPRNAGLTQFAELLSLEVSKMLGECNWKPNPKLIQVSFKSCDPFELMNPCFIGRKHPIVFSSFS